MNPTGFSGSIDLEDVQKLREGRFRWFLLLFRSLPLVEGHILWPRFRHSGHGFFLCRVPCGPSCNAPDPTPDQMRQVASLWDQALAEKRFGESEPEHVVTLAPATPVDDDEILQALNTLRSSTKVWFLSVQAPPDMPNQERSSYRDLGF